MLPTAGSTRSQPRWTSISAPGRSYELGITAQFVLLSSALLLRNEPEAALEAIDSGLSIVRQNDEEEEEEAVS